MAPKRQTYPEPPVVLPIGFNAWLTDCAPVKDCATCQSEWRKLNACKARDDIAQAARHATKIRDHSGGGHS